MNNMLNKINILREKLERQLLEEESSDEILKTSREIDELLVEFYKKEIPIKEGNLFLIK